MVNRVQLVLNAPYELNEICFLSVVRRQTFLMSIFDL